MKRYNPSDIEQKWQETWEQDGTYSVDLTDHSRPKYYGFSMLPGITGAGIHIGHGRTYQFSDIKVRAKRQQGYAAYHPIGWDSFGLPVENYAIKVGKKPRQAHDEAKVNFKRQLKRLGFSYDWSKEISTADPSYYKWTQWIFNKLYEHDLAYQKESPQWWCETDQTVLANEQVEGGKCWRCGNPVTKKNLKQWFFKITEYADEMLEATDDLNWTESVKVMQKNWIGKSQGAEVNFQIMEDEKPNFVILHGYTGRADKNFIPWLKSQLEEKGYKVQAPQMPNTDYPVESEQVGYVLENCSFDSNTVLIGHSLGGAVAMKVLQKLNHSIRQLVLVAPAIEPTFRPDGYDRPFINTFDFHYNYADIIQKAPNRLVISENQEAVTRRPYLVYLSEKIHAPLFEATGQRDHFTGDEEPFILSSVLDTLQPSITIFTTRPDTIFGATFMALAPEHKLTKSLANDETREAVEGYIIEAARKSEIERMNETREKTGVFTGSYAINPATGEKIPIWVADYVLAGYGTGAIMAVPAHDERDFAFADKFNIPIKDVVAQDFGEELADSQEVEGVVVIGYDPATKKFMGLKNQRNDRGWLVAGGREDGETFEQAAYRELREEAGFIQVEAMIPLGAPVYSYYYNSNKKSNRRSKGYNFLAVINAADQGEQALESHEDFETYWDTIDNVKKRTNPEGSAEHWMEGLDRAAQAAKAYDKGEEYQAPLYHGEGILINSGTFDGMRTEQAREEIVAWLEQQGVGRSKVTYKMRDWLISRQRYWGAPIPIVHCEKDGAVAVPDDQLPVILPDVDDFKPKGGATSVLAEVDDWVNTTCPKCGGPAKRETDTMDGYACSSWYHLRYLAPFDDERAWDSDVEAHWGPVDYYNGADHAVAHLLYARFWQRFFYKLGLVSHPEPFKRMMYNAYIQAADGQKMSKSKGNVIDPLEVMDSGYGADALRVYEMFIAPYDIEAPWDTRGVPGTYRFLNRVWNLVQEYIDADHTAVDDQAAQKILKTAHYTVKKITEDIEDEKFNTAVAAMMEAVNTCYKLKDAHGIGKSDAWTFALESLLQVLAPFAPHLTEELWYQLGHTTTIHVDTWPKWDDSYLQTDQITIIVQVNGKLRAKLNVAADASDDEVKRLALQDKKVTKFIGDEEPVKIIYVPGRLVNIVL